MRWIVFVLFLNFIQSAMALDAPPDLQFDVVRYEVTGANPLLPEVVSKVLKPYLGRHYGLEGLSAAVDELERKLKKEGHSFHRVILQPQSLQDGIVKLKVHEFKLGKLVVQGNKHFIEANIRNSLPSLVEGRAPNTRLLNRSLAVANEHPDKSLQMIFKEGQKPNTIDIDLNVADKSPHTSYAQLSNTGTEETGEIRLGVGYQYSNLFDKDHIASISYSTSTEQPENVAQWVLGYSFPLYDHGDQVSLFYSDSEIQSISTIDGFSGNFDVNGAGTVFGVRYMYSFKKIKGYKQKLFFGLDQKEFNNQIFFNNQPAPGTNKLKSVPLSVEYEVSRPLSKTPFRFAISFHQNTNDDQDNYNDEIRLPSGVSPDTNWNLIRYRGQYDLPIASWLLRLKLDGQYASEPLISGEQYGVGGSQSVRGYGEREILGDYGYSANIEFWNSAAASKFRWLVFYDFGQTTFNEKVCDSCDLKQTPSSIGGGVRYMWGRHVNIAADLAQVLEDYDETESGDIKLHLSMTYQY